VSTGGKITGNCRKQHKENVHDLYYAHLRTKSGRIRRTRQMESVGEKNNAKTVLVGHLKERDHFHTFRRRCEENIKPDHKEIEWEGWTGLIRLRVGMSGSLVRTR
jgi:hypothetical protein